MWTLEREQGKSGGLSEKQVTNVGAYHAPTLHGFCPCGAWFGSLGLEPQPELFVEHLVEVFRAVRRVLRPDGVLWLNLGDSYAGSGKGPTGHNGIGDQSERQGFTGPSERGALAVSGHRNGAGPVIGYKPKDLMMMPARAAMALQADGWYLRSMIPWLKRNSMPESVTDRPASAVEYVFLLSKSRTYFWDADAVRSDAKYGYSEMRGDFAGSIGGNHGSRTVVPGNGGSRNRRNSDWFFESWQGLMLDSDDDPLALVVNPQPFSGAHFATFPPKLVEPMVKASTSEKGQCSECGAPWVRQVETEYVKSPVHGAGSQMRNRAETTDVNGWAGMPRVARRDTTTGWRPSCAHTGTELRPLAPQPQVILDCFGGAGTVGLVADRLGRNAILCELKDSYGTMSTDRLVGDSPMFVEVEGVASGVSPEPITDKQGALDKRTYSGFNARWDAKESSA